MAVRINQYEQRTSPSSPGVQPRARGQQVDQGIARGMGQLAGALDHAAAVVDNVRDRAEAERKAQEAEDAKAWSAAAVAKANADMVNHLVTLQETTEPGAPEFSKKFDDAFTEYETATLANAPNETSRKFLQERMLSLRSDLSGRALTFEVGERRRWRGETVKTAVDTTAGTLGRDPTRYTESVAELNATIDAMALPPEQKAGLREYARKTTSIAAAQGMVERDPIMARAYLSDSLGIDVTEAAGGGSATADAVWERIIHQESRGNQSAVSPKGAVGIAQVMPETGPEAARLANLPWDPERFKNDANYNAALGRAYFDAQLAEFKTPMLAATAYNAGPGAVREWIAKYGDPRTGAISAADFAAKIPYKETRDYVGIVAPPSLTVAEAARLPAGEVPRTGNPIFDALDTADKITLLNRTNQEAEKQRAQFKSFVAAKEADDLAMFGDGKQPPQPLTAGEFVHAYGEVEGLRRFETYQSAQQFAGDVAGLASMTPADIQQRVLDRAPKPGPGYAAEARLHAGLVQAAQSVLKARAEDPIAFAMQGGFADNLEPLNLSDPTAFREQLRARVGIAATMRDTYGTGYTLLTKAEGEQLVQTMGRMTAPEKASFLGSIREALPDAAPYHAIMAQLRPDSPVTATAGSMLALPADAKVAVGSGSWFNDAPSLTAAQVAQKLLIGEDLLNPTKDAKGNDGKPKFPMPSDTDLRATWSDYTGAAYAGAPETEQANYQAFRAFYAAEAAAAGKYDGAFDEGIAARAAMAVTGGVADVGQSQIILPYGVSEEGTLDALEGEWARAREAAGLPVSLDLSKLSLQTVGDGRYQVNAGTGPVRDKSGRVVVLNVSRAAARLAP